MDRTCRIRADVWIEYPSFSPDGTKIVFMGHVAGDYDIYVADLAAGAAMQLTDAPGPTDGRCGHPTDDHRVHDRTRRLLARRRGRAFLDDGGGRGVSRHLAHGCG